jgi:hypothetical protein
MLTTTKYDISILFVDFVSWRFGLVPLWPVPNVGVGLEL